MATRCRELLFVRIAVKIFIVSMRRNNIFSRQLASVDGIRAELQLIDAFSRRILSWPYRSFLYLLSNSRSLRLLSLSQPLYHLIIAVQSHARRPHFAVASPVSCGVNVCVWPWPWCGPAADRRCRLVICYICFNAETHKSSVRNSEVLSDGSLIYRNGGAHAHGPGSGFWIHSGPP